MRPGDRSVRLGSSGLFSCALGVVGFVRIPLVPFGAPWLSLGSFRFIWIVRVGPGGRWVPMDSSGSSGSALGVIRVRHEGH